MRELKFRAWDEVNEKMLVVDELRLRNREAKNSCVFVKGRGWLEAGKPELVMQFTGLHDKNGREIYEGDIIEFATWNFGLVGQPRTTHRMVEWEPSIICGDMENECAGYSTDYFRESTVIGNIYENPELLQR